MIAKMLFGSMCAALALTCAGCGSSTTTDDVAVACVNGIASHDFGTTDAATLAAVTAYATGPGCAPDGEQITSESPGTVGYAMFSVPVTFVGSVGTVTCGTCNNGTVPPSTFTEVTFSSP